jgi:hypothetical protein
MTCRAERLRDLVREHARVRSAAAFDPHLEPVTARSRSSMPSIRVGRGAASTSTPSLA